MVIFNHIHRQNLKVYVTSWLVYIIWFSLLGIFFLELTLHVKILTLLHDAIIEPLNTKPYLAFNLIKTFSKYLFVGIIQALIFSRFKNFSSLLIIFSLILIAVMSLKVTPTLTNTETCRSFLGDCSLSYIIAFAFLPITINLSSAIITIKYWYSRKRDFQTFFKKNLLLVGACTSFLFIIPASIVTNTQNKYNQTQKREIEQIKKELTLYTPTFFPSSQTKFVRSSVTQYEGSGPIINYFYSCGSHQMRIEQTNDRLYQQFLKTENTQTDQNQTSLPISEETDKMIRKNISINQNLAYLISFKTGNKISAISLTKNNTFIRIHAFKQCFPDESKIEEDLIMMVESLVPESLFSGDQ